MKKASFFKTKKAISPVIATVLLIALTVSAGAIIWVITQNVFNQVNEEWLIENSGVADTTGNDLGDTIRLLVRNLGSTEGTINSVTVTIDGVEKSSWVLQEEVTINSLSTAQVFAISIEVSDMLRSDDEVTIRVESEQVISNTYDVTVPSVLSNIAVFYEGIQDIQSGDLIANGWTQTTLSTHGGGVGFNVVPSDPNDITVSSNDDLLFILENDTFIVRNFVLTADVVSRDNDFLGFAFRFIDENNYYWVGTTSDHHSVLNQAGDPTDGNIPYVDTYTNRLVFGKIEAGVTSIIAVADEDPTLQSNWEKSFSISVSGDSFSFQIDGDETLQATDTTFDDAGYFGFISLASSNSRFGNIFLQS